MMRHGVPAESILQFYWEFCVGSPRACGHHVGNGRRRLSDAVQKPQKTETPETRRRLIRAPVPRVDLAA